MSYAHRATPETWSGTYRGRQISAHRKERDWLVVVDEAPQNGVAFESCDEAAAWLRRRVDEIIAEQIFPGLSAQRNFGEGNRKDLAGLGGGGRR